MRIVPGALKLLRRAWSIRVALLIGALNGLYGAFDALQDLIPAYLFVSLNMVLSILCVSTRLLHQHGLTDEQD